MFFRSIFFICLLVSVFYLFAVVKSFRKKIKNFKTTLMTSFILLLDNNMDPYGQQKNDEVTDDRIVFCRFAYCASVIFKVSVSDLFYLSDLSSDERILVPN